jgi:hypothetical protein
MFCMTDVTRILNALEQGDPSASDKLLPLVYEELRVLARQRLANEKPGQTLQATALVHEAYLRLVGKENDQSWNSRGHFFAAAAEAMRRTRSSLSRIRFLPNFSLSIWFLVRRCSVTACCWRLIQLARKIIIKCEGCKVGFMDVSAAGQNLNDYRDLAW